MADALIKIPSKMWSQWRFYGLVAFVNCSIITIFMMAYFVGIYAPSPPYDDVYFPYFLVSGPIVWLAGMRIGDLLYQPLLRVFSNRISSDICIVIIPGIVNMILGSLQWMAVVAVFRWFKSTLNRL